MTMARPRADRSCNDPSMSMPLLPSHPGERRRIHQAGSRSVPWRTSRVPLEGRLAPARSPHRVPGSKKDPFGQSGDRTTGPSRPCLARPTGANTTVSYQPGSAESRHTEKEVFFIFSIYQDIRPGHGFRPGQASPGSAADPRGAIGRPPLGRAGCGSRGEDLTSSAKGVRDQATAAGPARSGPAAGRVSRETTTSTTNPRGIVTRPGWLNGTRARSGGRP